MIRKKRHGQVKFGENIAIMLVFFILLAMGLLFYGAWQRGTIKETIHEQFTKEAIRIALTVSYLPEVVCSQDNYIVENCFDEYKVSALSKLLDPQSPQYDEKVFLMYEQLFHESRVTIEKIFPLDEREIMYLYDNAPADDAYTEVIPTFVPVIVKDPTMRLDAGNSIAILKIEVFR